MAVVLAQFLSSFGANTFDTADIVAGLGGVVIAMMVFYTLVRARLTFSDHQREKY